MKINKLTLKSGSYPDALRHIPARPKVIYHLGADLNLLTQNLAIAIVGSRQMSVYGEQATRRFASELAGQGAVIVSGLALGVDSCAHQAALEAGGICIAVLPCSLDNIVPIANRRLAERILEQGGALVSEYPPGEPPYKQNFIARNRIMSGLAKAVVITEAGEKSGTLYTARFAEEQNKEVFVVPGNITNTGSIGSNNLIKSNRGALVTKPADVLVALGLTPHKTQAKLVKGRNANEQLILDLMLQGISDGDYLLNESHLNVGQFNQVLTMLEIGGKIRPLGLNHWSIC